MLGLETYRVHGDQGADCYDEGCEQCTSGHLQPLGKPLLHAVKTHFEVEVGGHVGVEGA